MTTIYGSVRPFRSPAMFCGALADRTKHEQSLSGAGVCDVPAKCQAFERHDEGSRTREAAVQVRTEENRNSFSQET
jgi:hypothetical protein